MLFVEPCIENDMFNLYTITNLQFIENAQIAPHSNFN